MSQWQIMKAGIAQPETFDDGVWASPGEPGFTTEHVNAEKARRKCDGYSYIGRSTQVSARTEAAIAARLEPAVTEEIDKLGKAVFADLVSKLPDGEERPKTEVDAEVAEKVAEEEPSLRAAIRAAVLKDMGLAE